MATAKLTWRKMWSGWLSADGHWHVRGPLYGQPMYWLYYTSKPGTHGSRVNETGSYADSLTFPTAAAAKKYAERRGPR